MNSELPKVDITYGTKRKGDSGYGNLYYFLLASKKSNKSIEITLLNGDIFVSNYIKNDSRKSVVVFSDRRFYARELKMLRLVERIEIEISQSVRVNMDYPFNPNPKTFNLILNKAHALGKNVIVFMKDGQAYKGCSISHDFFSVRLENKDEQIVIMYDAVERIVPLEEDGSLSE
ncbi:hypothetical protein ON011_003262 [Providencia rettgeri]|nr:hypothetical protein [Providencia rettgeri]